MRFRGALFVAMLVACGGSAANESTPPGAQPPAGDPPASDEVACGAFSGDIAVASQDLDGGYPPYAVSGCSLTYVSTSGALVLRDLATGAEEELASATERPRRPAASRDVIAWEAAASSEVHVRVRKTGETKSVEGPFVRAGEPRVSGTSVAFTAWVTDTDADVWLYDATNGEASAIFSGAAEQRFADVSADYVVATDFSEDPDGRYDGNGDLADIIVFDRKAATVIKRAAPNKQAFPMLVDGTRLGYLEWDLVHPEPKLQAYALRVGAITGPVADDVKLADIVLMSGEAVRPSTANGIIEWIASPDGKTVLWRAPADRSAEPVAVGGLEGLRLFAPASSSTFTVIASMPADRWDAAASLRAVAK